MRIKIKDAGKISHPENIVCILKKILRVEDKIDQKKEHCWVFGLDNRTKIEYLELVSLGTLSANLVHPREIFRLAVMKGVAGIIMAHNHPSGDVEPSEDDLVISRRLTQAGKILGIKVQDSIVLNNQGDFFSFQRKNLLSDERR